MTSVIALVLQFGIICPVLCGPWSVGDILPRSVSRVSFKECSVDPAERQDCGYYGVTEEQCYARECCWNHSEESDVPWCYHSTKTNSKRCEASEESGEECGWMGIRKEQCLASDCCWRPTHKTRTWCIKKVHIPVFTGECGITAIKPNTFGRIIGGEDAIPHSWPWMVSLQSDDRHFCGGSLINHQWILSAGHCIKDPDEITVMFGAHNVSSEDHEDTKVFLGVSKVYQHENYGFIEDHGNAFGGVKYDYLLLKLEQPVQFNDVISPLCLTTEAPSDGQYCYSMGWGIDEFNPDDYEFSVPDLLQQFMSPVIDSARCNRTDMYDGRIHPTAMCAGYEEGGRSDCMGDSGSPLVTKVAGRWSQVGIVSWGEPCALAMFPTVYAEVTQMVEWIEYIVADN